MHAPIKHIWFDFAGTLYRETPEFVQAHKTYRYKTYAEVVGISDMEQAQKEYDELNKQHGSHSGVFRALGKPSDFWARAVDSLDRKDYFMPDQELIETLRKLRETVPISLFTNFKRSKIDELFSHLQIPEEYFTNILSGDDVPERKPALDGFYLMIEKSGLPPESLIYIGDREAVDILPAKKVGMQTCLLYGNGVKTVADYSFDSFKELLSLVKLA